MTEPEIMTPEEVCEFLRIHRSTLYRMLKNREIPAFSIGSAWRFRRSEIEEWINEQRRYRFDHD